MEVIHSISVPLLIITYLVNSYSLHAIIALAEDPGAFLVYWRPADQPDAEEILIALPEVKFIRKPFGES